MPRHLLTSDPNSWKETITAEFKIVTPMFLGNANQDARLIRPTSIKGALRFWWRAMQWGRILNTNNNEKDALVALAKQEANLFGAADEKIGTGKFSLSVHHEELSAKTLSFSDRTNIENLEVQKFSPLHYLLGQGLNETRSAITSGSFKLQLMLSHRCTTQDKKEILQSLICLGFLGALGSRSRHGWGSVALTQLDVGNEEYPLPTDTSQLREWIKENISTTEGLPPLTAFSPQSRIDISEKGGQDCSQLLTRVGHQLQMYRSFGNRGKVGNQKAERNFNDDHDLIFNFLTEGNINSLPRRTVFGLPHNYHFTSLKGSLNQAKIQPEVKERQRRSSPLILHIHQFPSGQCAAIHSFLPAQFLPEGDHICVNGTALNKFQPQWEVITDFLDRFKQKETLL